MDIRALPGGLLAPLNGFGLHVVGVQGVGTPAAGGEVDLLAAVDFTAGTVTLTLGPRTTPGITQAWVLPDNGAPFILPVGGATYSIVALAGRDRPEGLVLYAASVVGAAVGAVRPLVLDFGSAPPPPPPPPPADPVLTVQPTLSWSPSAQEGATPSKTDAVWTGADTFEPFLIEWSPARDGAFVATTLAALTPFPAIPSGAISGAGDVPVRFGTSATKGGQTFFWWSTPVLVRDLAVPATVATVTFDASVYVPDTQTLWWKARLRIPGRTIAEAQWSTNDGVTANRLLEDTPGVWTMYPASPGDEDNLGPPQVDFSYFSGNPARRQWIRVRIRETGGGPWSDWSAEFAAPVPGAPAELPALPAADVTRIVGVPNLATYIADITTENRAAGFPGTAFGAGVMVQNHFHAAALWAYIAHTGDTSADARLLAQLRWWTENATPSGSQWKRSRLPSGDGGYESQHAASCIATICIARQTPRIWSQLTAQEIAKLSAYMEVALYGTAYVTSSRNTRPNSSKTMRGFRSGDNANFAVGKWLTPYAAGGFFGMETAAALLASFDLDEVTGRLETVFAAELGTGPSPRPRNLVDCYDQIARAQHDYRPTSSTPGSADSIGPTRAQIEAAIATSGAVIWRNNKYNQPLTLAGAQATAIGEIGNGFFTATIQPGISPAAGQPASEPFGRLVSGSYRGRIVATGSGANRTRWNAMPHSGLIGRPQEFEWQDGGGAGRSSPGYVNDGMRALLVLILAMHVQGTINLASAPFTTVKAQMVRGVEYCRFAYHDGGGPLYPDFGAGNRGYTDLQHGGGGGGAFLWNETNAGDTDYLRALFNLATEVLAEFA